MFRGKKNIGQDELKHNSGEADIRIAPVIAGSKRAGVLQTILGAVLVVVGAIGMTIGQAWGGATWGPVCLTGRYRADGRWRGADAVTPARRAGIAAGPR
ncbi:Phage tail assembly protein I [Cronobacter dublinensis 1210]|uniref:Phage tail assembly protein I n=1 Tax=Cronobacter dublinensis 1210 TaxID=1208656 RepID=A0ABM9QCY8_9ENTR|nr:Phage tail assembly protein I [Cronobacter dublinensis 1210]